MLAHVAVMAKPFFSNIIKQCRIDAWHKSYKEKDFLKSLRRLANTVCGDDCVDERFLNVIDNCLSNKYDSVTVEFDKPVAFLLVSREAGRGTYSVGIARLIFAVYKAKSEIHAKVWLILDDECSEEGGMGLRLLRDLARLPSYYYALVVLAYEGVVCKPQFRSRHEGPRCDEVLIEGLRLDPERLHVIVSLPKQEAAEVHDLYIRALRLLGVAGRIESHE